MRREKKRQGGNADKGAGSALKPPYRFSSNFSPTRLSKRYGAEMPVLEWRARLVCSQCAGREIDMVATGERR
jgi:hypothetical protein